MSWKDDGAEPSLTPRELEVLELVARGYSAKEIANSLTIAPRTVEGHIETVRLKMRARNKAHMVTQAVMTGCLVVGPEGLEARMPPSAPNDAQKDALD